jgi:hypothetical protein
MAINLKKISTCLEQLSLRLIQDTASGGRVEIDVAAVMAELSRLRSELTLQIRKGDAREAGLRLIEASLSELETAVCSCTADNVVPFAAISAISAECRRLARKAATVAAFASGVALTGAAIPAAAQDATAPTYIGMTDQDIGVMDRSRPEYDAKGIPMGGFRLFPSLIASANYDDNLFKTPVATDGWFFEEVATARLQSQWGRHFLEFYGGVDNYNYSKFSRLDLTDWNIGSDGRLDISRAMRLNAAGSYGEYHEPLNSPNTVGFQASPNRYDKGHADLSLSYQPNRLGFGFGGSYDRYDWQNTPLIGPPPGTLVNKDRNESEYQAYARVSYDFSPGYSMFVKGLWDDRQFDQFLDRSGLHRSNNGYRLDAGLDLQISHLVSGEIYVGYLDQKFAAPLTDVSGVDYGVNLNWYASPVFTVHLNGAHDISNTTLAGISASDDKSVNLSADYELRRNIILQGFVGYTNSKFVGSTRKDDLPSAGISMHYLMNRYASVDAGYTYSKRSSNVAGADYKDNLFRVGLTLHL